MSRLDLALREAIAMHPADAVLLADGENIHRDALLAGIERDAGVLDTLGAQRIASALDNGIAWVELDLAVRCLDRVHVPVPTFFTPAQALHVVHDFGADTWIGANAPGGGWQRAPLDLPSSNAPIWQRPPRDVALPAGTRCITYTSGTTGQPRGVCLGTDALLDVATSLVSAMRNLQPRRHLCVLPLATLLENIAGVVAPLMAGAQVALPSLADIGYTGASGLDPIRLLACIDRHQPDSIILVPQLLDAIVTACEHGAPPPRSLRCIAVGGARVGTALLARAQAFELPVFEGYGLSECASVVALNRPGAVRTGSAGKPLAHVRLRVDENGELLVRGASFLGYVGSEAMPPDEYATGDLGHIDDEGFIWIDGRRRNVFITAFGRNVSPEWVESELTAQPDIAQAVVHGEARPWNVAVVVPRSPNVGRAAIDAATAAANATLPDYARVARVIVSPAPFTSANGLATGNGRVRRDAVLHRYADEIDAMYSPETAELQ